MRVWRPVPHSALHSDHGVVCHMQAAMLLQGSEFFGSPGTQSLVGRPGQDTSRVLTPQPQSAWHADQANTRQGQLVLRMWHGSKLAG